MKPIISFTNLTKEYSHKTIFEGISLSLVGNKKVWLVWPNGVGKTTLCRILAGKEAASEWNITISWKVVYVSQDSTLPENVTVAWYLGNYIAEQWQTYRIAEVLEEVGLISLDPKSLLQTLSGGQQRRILFARLLLQEADILLLDEPTNHIDVATKEWLVQYIKLFPWMVVCISHDRSFLNDIAESIIHMLPKQLIVYPWNYDDYKEQHIRMKELSVARRDQRERQRKKSEEWLAMIRQRASVYVNPARWKLLRSKEKYVEREVTQKEPDVMQNDTGYSLYFHGDVHQSKKIVEIALGKTMLSLYGRQRIWLQWENGIWKTTFVRMLLHSYNPNLYSYPEYAKSLLSLQQFRADRWKEISLWYIDQHIDSLFSDKKLEEICLQTIEPNQLGSFLATIWLSYAMKDVSVWSLSYGQRMRLFLQLISRKSYDLLILDEPTNHMDILSKEIFENALSEYQWSLIIISHDEYFIQQVMPTDMWCLETDGIKTL